jgi:AcrR family transcriptional regulator
MPTANASQPDRRQRKSRAALQQALVRLIAEKPYEAITIEDVTEAADVARATFYAHYKDRAALLAEANQELIRDLTARVTAITPLNPPVWTGGAVAEVFRHAAEHRHLYLLVLRGEGGPLPREQLIEAFEVTATAIFTAMAEANRHKPRIDLPFVSKAYIGALLATLEAWLGGALPGEPEEVAVESVRQQLNGLEWSLGFAAGELKFPPADDLTRGSLASNDGDRNPTTREPPRRTEPSLQGWHYRSAPPPAP